MAVPFSQTVDASTKKPSWRRSFLALIASLTLQGMALLALGVTPLLTYEGLPEPQMAAPLHVYMPVIPILPPALRRGPGPRKSFEPSRLLAGFRFPVVVADEIGSGLETFGKIPEGVPYGFEIGVPGIPQNPPAPIEPLSPTEPIVVGGDVQRPQKRHYVNPVYPSLAAQARIQGTVVLEATIDEEGNVTNLRVLSSIPLLDAAALDAVRQWKYEPTLLNGRPVPILMKVSVNFELNR